MEEKKGKVGEPRHKRESKANLRKQQSPLKRNRAKNSKKTGRGREKRDDKNKEGGSRQGLSTLAENAVLGPPIERGKSGSGPEKPERNVLD